MKRLLVLFLAVCPLFGQNPLYLDLSGPWKTIIGDDPAYAKPEFDDSGWDTLSMPIKSVETASRQSHWLRKSFKLPAGAGREDLVFSINGLRKTFDVYFNNHRIGSYNSSYPGAVLFPVPATLLRAGETNVIAIHAPPFPASAGSASAVALTPLPVLLTGRQNAPVSWPAAARDARLRLQTSVFGAALVSAILGILFFQLWLGSRTEITLIGLAVFYVDEAILRAVEYGNTLSGQSAAALPWFRTSVAVFGFVLAEQFTISVRWRVIFLIPLAAAFLTSGEFSNDLTELILYFILAGELVLLVRHWKEYAGRRILLLTLIGMTALFTTRTPSRLRLFQSSFRGGLFYIRSFDVAIGVAGLILLGLLIRKLLNDRKEKQRLAGEFEAARAVQQLLLPASPSANGHFEVDAVYQPAQEVGGDFYWTRFTDSGALLLVTGDVSGKGLKAAMLVSVIVGVLRNECSLVPGEILASLNGALVNNTGGGFVTCCCARFDPVGSVTIANAGHLAPYAEGAKQL